MAPELYVSCLQMDQYQMWLYVNLLHLVELLLMRFVRFSASKRVLIEINCACGILYVVLGIVVWLLVQQVYDLLCFCLHTGAIWNFVSFGFVSPVWKWWSEEQNWWVECIFVRSRWSSFRWQCGRSSHSFISCSGEFASFPYMTDNVHGIYFHKKFELEKSLSTQRLLEKSLWDFYCMVKRKMLNYLCLGFFPRKLGQFLIAISGVTNFELTLVLHFWIKYAGGGWKFHSRWQQGTEASPTKWTHHCLTNAKHSRLRSLDRWSQQSIPWDAEWVFRWQPWQSPQQQLWRMQQQQPSTGHVRHAMEVSILAIESCYGPMMCR